MPKRLTEQTRYYPAYTFDLDRLMLVRHLTKNGKSTQCNLKWVALDADAHWKVYNCPVCYFIHPPAPKLGHRWLAWKTGRKNFRWTRYHYTISGTMSLCGVVIPSVWRLPRPELSPLGKCVACEERLRILNARRTTADEDRGETDHAPDQ